MFAHLFQVIRTNIVAYIIHGAVAFILVSAREVRETFVIDVKYFLWPICDFTNFLVLGQINIHVAKSCDSIVERAARINVHYTFSRRTRMIFDHVFIGKYLC